MHTLYIFSLKNTQIRERRKKILDRIKYAHYFFCYWRSSKITSSVLQTRLKMKSLPCCENSSWDFLYESAVASLFFFYPTILAQTLRSRVYVRAASGGCEFRNTSFLSVCPSVCLSVCLLSWMGLAGIQTLNFSPKERIFLKANDKSFTPSPSYCRIRGIFSRNMKLNGDLSSAEYR